MLTGTSLNLLNIASITFFLGYASSIYWTIRNQPEINLIYQPEPYPSVAYSCEGNQEETKSVTEYIYKKYNGMMNEQRII